MGAPYTTCNPQPGYTTSFCQFSAMMNHIVHVCGCVPEYVPDIRKIVNDSEIRACNFYEHATCVTYVRSYFDKYTVDCLPACKMSEYVQDSIQVNKM